MPIVQVAEIHRKCNIYASSNFLCIPWEQGPSCRSTDKELIFVYSDLYQTKVLPWLHLNLTVFSSIDGMS